ncbi:MAG: protoglobin domain-containing protein [Calditerrivibrio sp.]|uniref:protoglobin domain-containing protein n=1 Tax=Calditerrivibrio sp. TaxID=2792612 RepID=UPI003D0F9C33
MKYIKEVISNYSLTEKDIQNLIFMGKFMLEYADQFVDEFYDYMILKIQLPDSMTPDVIQKHQNMLKIWYKRFYEGKIDNKYLEYLVNIGNTHIKFHITQDMFNIMSNWVRQWFHEKIFQNVSDDIKRKELLFSMHKLMDINKDIISDAYYTTEIKKYSVFLSLRDFIISVSERIEFVTQIIILSFLIFLTISAAVYFLFDMVVLMKMKPDFFIIKALSSLLMIWVLSELLYTEINIIKGAKFKISTFVGVALIAFVRDLLIMTLEHTGSIEKLLLIILSITVLGLVYWLVTITETKDKPRR